MRTIRVTGKGLIKVHPDMIRITITLEGRSSEYGETLKRSAEDTEQLKDLLEPFGFKRTDLKTLSFAADTEYESYDEKVGDRMEYRRRFAGYKFRHVMKVEFDSDNDRLGQILYALAASPLHPEFRLSYTVKNPEAVKNKLLAKAVKDAAAKAKVLTEAAEIYLGSIQSMDYSWGEINFEIEPMGSGMEFDECCMKGCNSLMMDIEPDDIEVKDSVTVVWEIL